MLDTTETFINTTIFLMEEIKNVRREKNDLVARINILERENMTLKEKLNYEVQRNVEKSGTSEFF